MKVRKRSATIRDVARRATVSPATVSRYLNGTLDLPEDTSRRIDEAVRDLDYAPNSLAQYLSLGLSNTIGLAVPDIANPFFSELARAAAEEASKRGFDLMLGSTQGDPEREVTFLKHLRARRVDGIAFLSENPARTHLVELIKSERNIVLIDEDVPVGDKTRVFANNEMGGALALRHLVDHGHRRIAIIGGPPPLMTAAERRRGFFDEASRRGIDVPPRYEITGAYAQETGRRAIVQLLSLDPAPTAIFAASDLIAIGVLSEAHDRGIHIPHDVSLVGFDGISVSALLNPPLTTIEQPIERMGRLGIQALVELIADDAVEPQEQRLDVRLVERASVRRLPRV